VNLYARLADLKGDMNVTGTSDDDERVRMIEDVSRAVDDLTHRRFYSETATRYFDGEGYSDLWTDDLVSVTTLKVDEDGDGVYELTLAANADYWLWPDNTTPKRRIDLNPESAQLTAWPRGRRRIEIAGVFGYSDDTELTTTTLNEALDATETAVDLVDGTAVSVGETLVVDAEQIYVSAIAGNTPTVVRGVNGTTAAAHSDGAAVYRRRYARPIERAVKMQVARFLREQQTGGPLQGNGEIGGFSVSSLYPAIRDMLAPYIRRAAVVA